MPCLVKFVNGRSLELFIIANVIEATTIDRNDYIGTMDPDSAPAFLIRLRGNGSTRTIVCDTNRWACVMKKGNMTKAIKPLVSDLGEFDRILIAQAIQHYCSNLWQERDEF